MAAIREINLRAFNKTYEPDLVDRLRADPSAWVPDLSIVASSDAGQLVGHVLLSRCHIDRTPALTLGPCAVLPEFQRRGVGGAVIRAAISAARAQGHHLVVLLGHADYYPRFGFKPAATFAITSDLVDSGPHLMALPLDATPVPAGTIRYPAAWDS